MMQKKLKEEDAKLLHEAADIIQGCFGWVDTDEGVHFWGRVAELLRYKACNGTSDGKPYVEPEPPIPEGYRKANADEWTRKDVKFWSVNDLRWNDRPAQGGKFDAPIHGTRYIVPIDPPLTDEDARTRPWVMVRDYDDNPWQGPAKLLAATEGLPMPFIARCGGFVVWAQARRATPEEIEAAHGNS